MMRRGVGRVGRPGLIGTAARTAVIAGTATAVSGNVARRQANRAEQKYEAAQFEAAQAAPQPAPVYQAPPPAPEPAAAPAGGLSDELVAQLKQLAQLKDAGILTEDEFAAKKAKLLGI